MTIRALSGDDTERYIAFYSDGVTRFPNAFLRSLAEVRDTPATRTAEVLEDGNIFGAFGTGGTLVGIAGLARCPFTATRHRAQVGPFYVSPDHHGSGAAQALMDAVVDRTRHLEITQLELFVWFENLRAQRFYARNGFAQTGVVPRSVMIEGQPHDDFFMVRALDR